MKLLAMAASIFLMLSFLSLFVTSNAQSNCHVDIIEFEALKAVLTAMDRSFKFSNNDLCVSEGNNEVTCDDHCHIITIVYKDNRLKGKIDPAIGKLIYLQTLNLEENVIEGILPKEIGKLHNLQNLIIRRNNMNGHIPPEIGYLVSLKVLKIGSNSFNGPIPRELGKLRNLTELDIEACGLEGKIPIELASLTSLQIWNGYGNEFNSSIPDIFSNMVDLRELRLYGNNFEGPLPQSLKNLAKLEILYMGDMSTNTDIPHSLRNLTALKELSLRDCQLTGEIDGLVKDLDNLSYLDLSFNKLSGSIPAEFGLLKQLKNVFLENNTLNGNLPDLINLTSLKNFDVSHNQLNGTLPAWIKNSNLQINLAWNFFNTTKSLAEFNCDNPKCSRVGHKSYFHINCGGSITTFSNIVYDNDDEGLKDVQFVQYTNKSWAISTTGYPIDDDSEFKSVIHESPLASGEQDLYSTARASLTSLRYYGMNMKKGNYDVTLHFAEIPMESVPNYWANNRKRIFDIYIKGKLFYKNYNIMDRNRTNAYAHIVETFKDIYVEDGVLEIHLKWSGKGTKQGPIISAIAIVRTGSSKSISKVVVITTTLLILLIVIGVALCLWHRIRLILRSNRMEDDGEEFKSIRNKLNLYTYNELRDATNDFHPTNKLGQGGFGTVYKGILKDGITVAIKQLSLKSPRSGFLNEILMIFSIQHRNLVKLLGCCLDGDQRILVLEFMENNSLYKALLGPSELRTSINWPTRVNICLGIARGIAYLHDEITPRIIHRDIKSSNILLDKDLNPKIADFGLAKLFKEEDTHVSTRIAGTIGYLAPEYAMRGQLTEKADVYSFGVLLLEIVSGRNNMDHSLPRDEMCLLDHAWNLYEKDCLLDIVDMQVRKECSEEEAKRIIKVALLCTQDSLNQRPTMTEVVSTLSKPCEIDVSRLQREEYEDYMPFFSLLSREENTLGSTTSMLSSMDMPSHKESLIR